MTADKEAPKKTKKPAKPKEIEINVLGQMFLDAKQDKQSKTQLP